MSGRTNILTKKLKVINVGIETFADELRKQGVEVVRVDWRPPAVDEKLLELMDEL